MKKTGQDFAIAKIAPARDRGDIITIMPTRKYLNLLQQLAFAQFKLKDQSAFLGIIWSFLNPLIMLGILFALFRVGTGKSIEHYAIYILVGLVQYTHFANSSNRAMSVLRTMKGLTADAIFPKELLVLSAVLADAVEFLVSMLICLLIAGLSGIVLSWTVVLLPFVWILQLIFVASVSLVLSCLYVFVRDVAHIYQAFLRVLIFITPIFYDMSFLGEGLGRYILLLNPLTHLINFSRSLIIEGRTPPLDASMFLMIVSFSLFVFSFKVFKNYEPRFAEHV